MTNSRPKEQRFVTDLSASEAKQYLLQSRSYCTFSLPKYFEFDKLLEAIDQWIESNLDFSPNLTRVVDANYKIFGNKDGKYAWRKFQLMNPLGYVDLVRKITEEDNWNAIKSTLELSLQNKIVKCASIPIVNEDGTTHISDTINNWWTNVEQQSIKLAIDYKYVAHIDIASCYDSIYTHSIAWALLNFGYIKENEITNTNTIELSTISSEKLIVELINRLKHLIDK